MVPLWKRALSRTMTAAINALEAAQERRAQGIPAPTDDPWYEAPEALDEISPGTLLAHRPIAFRGMFSFAVEAQAWHLRYRSTDTAGRPISAVATLLMPTAPWTGRDARPLLAYQAAIDSLGARADPSYTLQFGATREFMLVVMALRRGWAVLIADYTGPNHAFGAGILAAHITLDGVRAALQLEPAGLSADTPVGLWGYSGGGQATAFAAEQHPLYAPELRVTAVAAGGVPTDNRTLYRIDGGFLAGFALGGWIGVSREHPEVNLLGLANEEGQRVFAEVADMKVEELIAYFPFRRVRELTTVDDPFGTEAALVANEELALGRRLPDAPVYLYHAIYDQLVPIATADDLAAAYRQGGVDVTLKRSHLGEHVLFHRLGAFAALRYLAARLENPPEPKAAPLPAPPEASAASA